MNKPALYNAPQKSTLAITIGTIAALLGIASGFMYEYHQSVVHYRPDDVSHAIGLYLWLGSIVLWVTLLVVLALRRNASRSSSN